MLKLFARNLKRKYTNILNTKQMEEFCSILDNIRNTLAKHLSFIKASGKEDKVLLSPPSPSPYTQQQQQHTQRERESHISLLA